MNQNVRLCNLPTRLFEKNPKLVDISMDGNNFTTIDQHKFPLHQLKRLKLGNNPFECTCGLSWLWYLSKRTRSSASSDYGEYYQNSIVFDTENIFCLKLTNGDIQRIKLIEIDQLELICSPEITNFLLVIVLTLTSIAILFVILKLKKHGFTKTSLHQTDTPISVDKRFEIEQFLCEKNVTNLEHTWESVGDTVKTRRRSEEMEYFILCNKNKNERHLGAVFV